MLDATACLNYFVAVKGISTSSCTKAKMSTKLSVMKSFSFLIIESAQVCGENEGDGVL